MHPSYGCLFVCFAGLFFLSVGGTATATLCFTFMLMHVVKVFSGFCRGTVVRASFCMRTTCAIATTGRFALQFANYYRRQHPDNGNYRNNYYNNFNRSHNYLNYALLLIFVGLSLDQSIFPLFVSTISVIITAHTARKMKSVHHHEPMR